LLAITVLAIGAAIARSAAADALRDAFHIVLVAASAALGLLALFHIIPMVADSLSGRFIWYLPLTLVTALAIVASQAVRPAAGRALVLVLAAVLLVQAERTASHVVLRLGNPPQPNVRFDDTISPAHYGMPPIAVGSRTLVSPRDFFWINRSYSVDRGTSGGR
jgi:hypothetical protein